MIAITVYFSYDFHIYHRFDISASYVSFILLGRAFNVEKILSFRATCCSCQLVNFELNPLKFVDSFLMLTVQQYK